MITDTYTEAVVINYSEGDQSLDRIRITHKEDIEDKIHTLIDGDTLTALATRFYGRPLLWFIIADVNNIENPLELTTGQNIIIPNIEKYNV